MTATTLWWLELCDFYGVVVLRFYDKGGIENIHQSLANSFKTLFYTGTYWKKNFSNYKHMQNKKCVHYTMTRSFWDKLALNSVGSDVVLCVGHKEYVNINIFVILFEHTSIILCKTFSMGAFYSIW